MGSDKLPKLFDLHYFLLSSSFSSSYCFVLLCIDSYCFVLLPIASYCFHLPGVAMYCLALLCFAWPCLAMLHFIDFVVAKVFSNCIVSYTYTLTFYINYYLLLKRRSYLSSVCLLLSKLLSSHSPSFLLTTWLVDIGNEASRCWADGKRCCHHGMVVPDNFSRVLVHVLYTRTRLHWNHKHYITAIEDLILETTIRKEIYTS